MESFTLFFKTYLNGVGFHQVSHLPWFCYTHVLYIVLYIFYIVLIIMITWKKYPNWVRYFSSQLVYMSIFIAYFLCFCCKFHFELLITQRKIIPPRWDLTCLEVKSHLSEMKLWIQKGFVFIKWNSLFCWDFTQVRYPIQVGCLI